MESVRLLWLGMRKSLGAGENDVTLIDKSGMLGRGERRQGKMKTFGQGEVDEAFRGVRGLEGRDGFHG